MRTKRASKTSKSARKSASTSKSDMDGYLEALPVAERRALGALRKTIRRLLPNAEEGRSYGMPCFKLDGKGVAGFAAFANHCTYFPMSGSVVGVLRKDLSAYRVTKGGVQFAADEPLPLGLVKKLVKARLDELSVAPANGPARAYYDNGVLLSKGSYKGGKMHGKWEFFRRDGSVMRTGKFQTGTQVGIWSTWDKAGRVVKETKFGG